MVNGKITKGGDLLSRYECVDDPYESYAGTANHSASIFIRLTRCRMHVITDRYSYAIISDDHGATWRVGSEKIQPRHSTECSVAQSFDGDGDVYIYTRIWEKNCVGAYCTNPSTAVYF